MKAPVQLALGAAAVLVLVGCSAAADMSSPSADSVTVTNCGQEVEFPAPAQRLFVNDSNLISMILALGAEDQVAAVSSINR
jgi:iron complex transport system substrate-binding protein